MTGRKVLWFGLGVVWLIDGGLQAQPAMFTDAFVKNVIQPTIGGQPAWLAGAIQGGIGLWLRHLTLLNAGAVAGQLLIGLLLVFGFHRWWGRIGLAVSIGWGLLLWFLGEGLGGVLTGSPSGVAGAPGAAVIYVLGAILLLLPASWWSSGLLARWSLRLVGLLWLLAAAAQAVPAAGFFTSDGLSGLFRNAAQTTQPGSIAAPIRAMASAAASAPVAINAVFVAVLAVVGFGFLAGVARGWVAALAVAWLLYTWWMGQAFGAIFSGTGTDLNLSIPLALLILALTLAVPRAAARAGAAALPFRTSARDGWQAA